ncbi:uncharacterized protein LOC126293554 isoform X2 [Schistocerca gregaria]|uniref:uncharacterized protein LOC126293554 isoform X2 n=1 Tax=Schistocerca gregaria TaxID=7010 RepID=UPI00211E9BE6|nr:uncharacterized protein LOC126293554 isoform X2 [Schistocerca gregaria]
MRGGTPAGGSVFCSEMLVSCPAVVACAVPYTVPVLQAAVFRPLVRSDWYDRLRKPRWTPPRWAYAPVWSALYAAMGAGEAAPGAVRVPAGAQLAVGTHLLRGAQHPVEPGRHHAPVGQRGGLRLLLLRRQCGRRLPLCALLPVDDSGSCPQLPDLQAQLHG